MWMAYLLETAQLNMITLMEETVIHQSKVINGLKLQTF